MKLIIYICLLVPFICSGQDLNSDTQFIITKSWHQEPNGYTYPVNFKIPDNQAPANGFPVCILLHGNGGNGGGMVNQFSNFIEDHVLIAPTGYINSWNICNENSDAPDLEMVNDLVEQLQTYDNINSNRIRIIGSSNGAGLANNVFIVNDNPGIDIICAIVSHLNVPQYHLDQFYLSLDNSTNPDHSYCGYNEIKTPLSSRKYLSISNDNDPIIPYNGGTSVVGVDFLNAEDAIYQIALNQGYSGEQLSDGVSQGNPEITEFSYLSSRVVHIKGNAQHSTNISQRNYLRDFLTNSTTSTSELQTSVDAVQIFPNPSHNIVSIIHSQNTQETYSLHDISGKLILRGKILNEVFNIDLSHLESNIYFLKIGQQTHKILKL